MKAKIDGVTLLELLLVLVVISAILLLSVQQYRRYQADQNAIQLRYNVNVLLEALTNYYNANCQKGTLSPIAMSFPPVPPVFNRGGNLYNDLMTYYITSNWRPLNPLVDNSAPNDGYIVQFNYFLTSGAKSAYVCYNFWNTTGTAAPGCNTPMTIPSSRVVGWEIQVAVKMRDPSTTAGYLGLTGADCAVDSIPTDRAAACVSGALPSATLNYLVWQRVPSFASPDITSAMWMSNPVLKEFKLQYTNDPMYEIYLQGTGGTVYYLCGG